MRGSSTLYRAEVQYDDLYGNLSGFKELMGNTMVPHVTTFAYDAENRPTTVQYGSDYNRVAYAYDLLGRITGRVLTAGGSNASMNYTTSYSYVPGGHGDEDEHPPVAGIANRSPNEGALGEDKRGRAATAEGKPKGLLFGT